MSQTQSLDLASFLDELEKSAGVSSEGSSVEGEGEGVGLGIADELKGILEKKASESINQQAMEAGKDLARKLLEKAANEIISNDAATIADDNAKVEDNPGGTLEDSLQGTVDRGLENGGTTDDRVDEKVDEGKGAPAGESKVDAPNPPENEKKAEQNMTTQVEKTLAELILEKIASDGAPVSTDNTGPMEVEVADAPNQIQKNDAANVDFDDSKVQDLPGAGGTYNVILEKIVSDAKASGAGSDDLVNGTGDVPPSQNDELQKAAAVAALVEEGVDFNSAVDLVKEAEAALFEDSFELQKVAAFDALLDAGIDFEKAAGLVNQAVEDLSANFYKQASQYEDSDAWDAASRAHRSGAAGAAGGALGGGSLSAGIGALAKNHPRLRGLKVPGVAAIGAGIGSGAGYLYGHKESIKKSLKREREKKAAFDALIGEGIDFDSAVSLIQEYSEE